MTGPRFNQVAGDLRERIAFGNYAGSGALESEAELCRRYGVSRITVRRALEQLRDEGLLTSRKGAGWYVAGTIHQPVAVGTFQHAASAVAEAGLVLRRKVVEFGYVPIGSGDVATSLGLDADGEVLRVRSVRSASHTPLDAVTEWVPAGVSVSISRADAEQRGIWESLRGKGIRIDLVRQSITAVAAGDSEAKLLGVTTGAPLLLVRRLALGPDGAAVALADHRYLGHRFSLDVEFRGWPGNAATEPPGLTSINSIHSGADR